MSTPSFSNEVIPSLPTIAGNGIFQVTELVPNSAGAFEPTDANPSTSYSYPLMDPAKLIGTPSTPYMNVALPAYITTLYKNVYNINTKLTNDISEAAANDRKYPTSYAVQQYVQSQIAGTQIINGDNNVKLVNTTMTNTLIQTAVSAAQGFTYVNGDQSSYISVFWMDETLNAPRNGATKTVMFSASGYLTNLDGSTSGNIAFLYAGDDSHFVHLGQQYKHYQFVIRGDFLDFVQSYNSSTSSWDWLVKDSLGVFSNTISVSNASGESIPISRVIGAPNSDVPEGLTLTS
jgi:hypothetical protein